METISQIRKVITVGVAMLLLAGCAGFLKPQPGALAKKEARIALAGNNTQGVWETGDLKVNYVFAIKDGSCALDGKLVISDNIGNSFPTITSFFFYLSFLDQEGRVVETVDISPLITTYGHIPASLPLRMTNTLPSQAKFVAFHYYGGFRANPLSEGGNWEIHHFPFAR